MFSHAKIKWAGFILLLVAISVDQYTFTVYKNAKMETVEIW